jgi:hypothetical protein
MGTGSISEGAMLTAALAYAARGWRVFPLRPRGKEPALTRSEGGRGVHDATIDPVQIMSWWAQGPERNIGIATGATSDLLVIDVDAGKGGVETMRRLVAEHGPIPQTMRSKTGSGWHLFFRLPSSPTRSAANVLGPGVDTRSHGGYVVAPPSVHPNGQRYRWVGSGQRPAACPAWIARLCAPAAPPEPAALTPPRAPVDVLDRAAAYLGKMEPAIQGQNGSARAMWAAICMVRGFELGADDALRLMELHFNPRCVPPWARRELVHKIESAQRSTRPLGFLLNVPRRRAA